LLNGEADIADSLVAARIALGDVVESNHKIIIT
jgi:hypothetical protein